MNNLSNRQDEGDYNAKPDSLVTANDQESEEIVKLILPDNFAGLRLDQALARLLPQWSRSRLQRWIEENRVHVDNSIGSAKQKIWGGETVQVAIGPIKCEQSNQPEAIPLHILYEDDYLLVIDKPAELVVHPGNGNWHGTLLNALLNYNPQLDQLLRAGIVHRLDKDTSGLLVIAKTAMAQANLITQFKQRTIQRHYWALVLGHVTTNGVIDAPIGRHPVRRTRMAIVPHGKEARTHYQILEHFSACTVLQCSLETGRTHQIRVHLRSIGHPLVGDPVYGKSSPDSSIAKIITQLSRQALHAWQLELTHPASGKTMHWEASLPDDLARLVQAIRALP